MSDDRLGYFPCHSCGTPVKVINAPALDVLVASDCQSVKGQVQVGSCPSCGLIQKHTSASWAKLCDEIYRAYRIYHQASGQEQKARGGDESQFAPRSQLIADYLRKTGFLAERGSLIDVGCGNGAFLGAMRGRFPEWTVTGTDLNENYRKDILALGPNAAFLSGNELATNSDRFNLLVLIHCLEHIPAPAAYLANSKRHLSKGSLLLVEVPDAELNPFDFVIADHASHFSKASLQAVVESAGYEVVTCGNLVLGKEITLIARPVAGKAAANIQPSAARAEQTTRNSLAWLNEVTASARRIAALNRPFGVFGTSIAGSWIGQALDRIDFYVDEDESRTGRNYLGAPVVVPSEIPTGATVFVCLEPRLAVAIAQRLAAPGRKFLTPPATAAIA